MTTDSHIRSSCWSMFVRRKRQCNQSTSPQIKAGDRVKRFVARTPPILAANMPSRYSSQVGLAVCGPQPLSSTVALQWNVS